MIMITIYKYEPCLDGLVPLLQNIIEKKIVKYILMICYDLLINNICKMENNRAFCSISHFAKTLMFLHSSKSSNSYFFYIHPKATIEVCNE